MKSLFKYVFATLVGLVIFCILWVLFFMAAVGVALAGSDTEVIAKENSVFELKLSGQMVERSEEDWESLMRKSFMGGEASTVALDEVLSAIKKAKAEDNIKGIYLNIGNFYASMASMQEVYSALADFKESGKFIVSYADNYGNGTYYLSSIADKIYMNHYGTLTLTGISMQTVYMKSLFDKLGIETQVFKVGTFKSAVEPFIQNTMSDANRLQLETFTSSIWGEITQTIAANRKVSVEKVNEFTDKALAFADQKQALDYSLVDELIYQDDMKKKLEALTKKDYKTLSLKDMTNLKTQKKRSKDRIAVVYAVGDIDDGSTGGIKSEKLSEELLKLAENEKVKGVVLRVNSPGGSAFGSEQIWHAVQVLKEKKPVAVSMGDYAASGGYYISCHADRIFAQPTTLTGSIGIFGMFMTFEKATKKIGVNFETVKTNKHSDLFSVNRPMTSEEQAIMQNYVEMGYDLFTKRCADGRGVSQDSIKKIAEGRIYSGTDALALGLVDELGGIDKAIEFVAKKANIDDYKLSYYPAPKNMFDELMKGFSLSLETRILKARLGENYSIYETITNMENKTGLQTIMPYRMVVK